MRVDFRQYYNIIIMNTIKKYIFIFLFSVLLSISVFGQVRQPHSLYFLETIPQISQMNPALQPRANNYLILPVNVNFDFSSDLAVKDLLQQRGSQWHTPIEEEYDYSALWKSIGKKATQFVSGVDCDIIGFGFRTNNGYFSFRTSVHASGAFALPSDFFKITERGLPDGTKLDFSPLRVRAIAYKQITLGYSLNLTEQLTVGVNVKPIFGLASAQTDINAFSLHTGKQQWDVTAKGAAYLSGPFDVYTNENDKNKIDSVKMRTFELSMIPDYLFTNPGVAFDFGASYKIDEQFTVSAALNNLGFMSWRNALNGANFDSKASFDGITYNVAEDDFDNIKTKDLIDSILKIDFMVQKEKFKTPVTPVLHLGATYQVTEWAAAGFLSRTVFWKNAVRQSFNLSANLQPYNFVSFNLGATYQVKGNICLSSGFMFLMGPLQFYFLTDYVPVYYSTLEYDGNNFMIP